MKSLKPLPKRAFSLFITLVCVILITLFMVSLLQSVSQESTSSRLYTTSMDLNRLADSTVNIVQAQITAATSQSPTGRNSDAISWASQPGMIRTYGTDGRLHKAYKLYSWTDMVIDDQDYDSTEESELPPANWQDQPALFTDLNEGVNGVYPIVDPDVLGGGVEGFDVDPTRVEFDIEPNSAPMPVKWVYILQNGSMSLPSPGSSIESAAVNGASADNPIVGRVAFWTDDESSKINLNTAGEGSFWDMPKTASPHEAWEGDVNNPSFNGLSTSLPVYDEYQRVPGHPATTSLSSVLGDVLPVNKWIGGFPDYQMHEPYFSLAPRLAPGGSQGGLTYIEADDQINLTLDADRLYASVGELLFDPERNRDSEGYSSLDTDIISERRFFLTSASRAPEENLFNKPRLSLWPLQNDESQPGVRNAKDKLIAFVSELGQGSDGNPLPYYFQRNRAYGFNSATTLGSGDFGSAHSTTEDFDEIERNQNLLQYLYDLSASNFPGFGASLAAKYPQDIEQILVNSFDYIRSGINTVNTGLEPKYNYTAFNFNASGGDNDNEEGRGFVMPIRATVNGIERQGFGRSFVIKEFSLVFWPAGWKDNYTLGTNKVTSLDFDEDGDKDSFRKGGEPGNFAIWVRPGLEDDFPDTKEKIKLEYPDIADELEASKELRIIKRFEWLSDPKNVLRSEADGLPDDVAENRHVEMFGTDYMLPVWDGVGDSQTEYVGAFFLINPVNLLAGPPEILNSVRYEVEGLDNIPIDGSNAIRGPNRANAVMVVRGGHQASQAMMGFYDIINTPETNGGRELEHSDGVTSNHRRTDREAKKFPWFSEGNAVPPAFGGDGPTDTGNFAKIGLSETDVFEWKLTGRGNYVKRISGNLKSSPEDVYGKDFSEREMIIDDRPSMRFGPVNLTVRVYPGLTNSFTEQNVIQEYNIEFPAQTVPLPQVLRANPKDDGGDGKIGKWERDESGQEGFLAFRENAEAGVVDDTFVKRGEQWRTDGSKEEARWQRDFYYGKLRHPEVSGGHSSDADVWDFDPRKLKSRFQKTLRNNVTIRRPDLPNSWLPTDRFRMSSPHAVLTTGDVIRSLVVSAQNHRDSPRGDLRLIANRRVVPEEFYEPHPDYDDEAQFQAHSIIYRSQGNIGGFHTFGRYGPDTGAADLNPMQWHDLEQDGNQWELFGQLVDENVTKEPIEFQGASRSGVSPNLNGAYMRTGASDAIVRGDFDTGQANMRDGPWLNKADEAYGRVGGYKNVYYPHNEPGIYGAEDTQQVGVSYSPNRQIASAVMMGSLPTGVHRVRPWETLLFNPIPAAGDQHPGHGSGTGAAGGPNMRAPFEIVPDHVFLDMFFMPISEPYPISERFSTAGKVNMNYAMMPFPHIERTTGIHAVLKNAKVMAIPNAAVTDGNQHARHKKGSNHGSAKDGPSYRYDIDPEKTLDGFEQRFYGESPDIFRSASEITRIYMVPKEPSKEDGFRWDTVSDVYNREGLPETPDNYEATKTWYDAFLVTGDNARESVYNQIYPRVTTKSNTYRVHYRVQTLKKRRASNQDEWVEGADQVLGEMRGSALIERYLDPNARNIPDYATENDPIPLHSFYRWRVIAEQQFRP